MADISLWTAFGGGVLSFLSPCVLPLVPVYLASLVGPEILEPGAKRISLGLFLHSVCFVIGFSTVFVSLGTIAGLAGLAINSQTIVRYLAGSLLLGFGLFMLASWKVPRLNYEKRLTPSQGATTGYLRSLLIGGIFALAWTPCVGPVLGGILALALDSATACKGAWLLAAYSLGLGIPFLVIGTIFGWITPLVKQLSRYSRLGYVISGVLLSSVGILVLTDRLVWLNTILG